LSIVEIGGYPDFTPLYRKHGFDVVSTDTVRKAVKLIRAHRPSVMVAEFNFQSDFRDRTSSLETLMSSTQGVSDARMIVFYEREFRTHYEKFLSQFTVFDSIEFPIDAARLEQALARLKHG
jgi:DNA-binding NtrC family response regulator